MPGGKVLAFPDTPVARARRGIQLCRNHKMLRACGDRIRRMADLTREERLYLACQFARRHVEISLGQSA